MGGCFSNDDYYDTGSSSSSSRGYYRRPPPPTVLPFDNNNHHLHNSNTLYGGSTPYVVPTFSSRGISVSTRRTVLTPLPSSVLSPSSSISPSSSSKNKHTSISRDEVKRHNTQNDCWIIVQNRVYNVTSFHHPGGTAILYALAGRDATHTFSSHHNFDPSKNHLQKYYIGDLIGW